MFLICLPSCPQHRSLSLHHCPLMDTFLFSFCNLFFWLDQNPFIPSHHGLVFVSFHLRPPLSPTHPLSLFSKPYFPHMTVISSLMISFSTQRWPLHLPLLTCVCPLLPHFSSFFGLIYCCTLPTGRLLLSYHVFPLLDSLCSCLFLPSVSDLLFVLILWNSSAGCPRLLPTTVRRPH